MTNLYAKIHHQAGSLTWNFEFKPEKSIVAIRGVSGVGKSLFLKIIAGVSYSAHSHVEIGSRLLQSPSKSIFVPSWKRNVGWLPQNLLLFPHLSVRQNLQYSSRSSNDEIQRLADRLKIAHLLSRYPKNLSGGESQRVALGRCLLSQSDLFALDEPFSALDDTTRESTRDVVLDWLSSKSIPLVMVTHHDEDIDGWDCESWVMGSDGTMRRF